MATPKKSPKGQALDTTSYLVNQVLKDPKARRALATHERVLDTHQENQED
jgi:hypothetical protein